MLLLIAVPLYFFFVLMTIGYAVISKEGVYTSFRKAWLYAILIGATYCVLITECLSWLHLIRLEWILCSYLIPAIGMTIYCVQKGILTSLSQPIVKVVLLVVRHWMLSVIVLLSCLSLLIAIAYPPNNYDSMTYHMARVAHWIQNQQIGFYPTHVGRQLIFQPFAEWVILHVDLLTGGDRFANSIQLFFYIGCISNVTLIAKELGGSVRQQMLAGFFAGLLPMALLQSNTTQNDLVASFYVLAFVYLTIVLQKRTTIALIILCGMALGLAWLTKGTSYVFTIPFSAWYLILILRPRPQAWKNMITRLGLFMMVPVIALLMNAGYFYRNATVTGSVFGTSTNDLVNQHFAIKPIILIAIKNAMNHFPVTEKMKEALMHQSARFSLDANDPRYSYTRTQRMAEGFSFSEDYIQNTVHFLLILVLSIFFVMRLRSSIRSSPIYSAFVITLFTNVLLFCVLLKWQPWSNRLETPLFLLFCVFMALEFDHLVKWIRIGAMGLMVGFGTIGLLFSEHHPVLPIKKTILVNSYASFIYSDAILKCSAYLDTKPYSKLGIVIGGDSWDYPYYKLLSNFGGKKRELQHVLVDNLSAKFGRGFIPDVIISIDGTKDQYSIGTRNYYRTILFSDGTALFETK